MLLYGMMLFCTTPRHCHTSVGHVPTCLEQNKVGEQGHDTTTTTILIHFLIVIHLLNNSTSSIMGSYNTL